VRWPAQLHDGNWLALVKSCWGGHQSSMFANLVLQFTKHAFLRLDHSLCKVTNVVMSEKEAVNCRRDLSSCLNWTANISPSSFFRCSNPFSVCCFSCTLSFSTRLSWHRVSLGILILLTCCAWASSFCSRLRMLAWVVSVTT